MNNKKIRVYLAGDSTVQTYSINCAPQAGWGQFIENYFNDKVQVLNHAIGGRSSKTFINEGRLKNILDKIEKDDYLIIQMGHNDASIDKPERYTEPNFEYKEYLSEYIDGAFKKGAIPILITPVATLKFDGENFLNEFPEYCNSMKQLAKDKCVIIIDLMSIILEYFKKIGYDETYELFMVSSNGTDYTHFTEKGANTIAKLVSEEIKKIDINFLKI